MVYFSKPNFSDHQNNFRPSSLAHQTLPHNALFVTGISPMWFGFVFWREGANSRCHHWSVPNSHWFVLVRHLSSTHDDKSKMKSHHAWRRINFLSSCTMKPSHTRGILIRERAHHEGEFDGLKKIVKSHSSSWKS